MRSFCTRGTFVLPSTNEAVEASNLTVPRPEIIFFGRLEERKGLLEFLEAIEALAVEAAATFSVSFVGKDVRLYSPRTGRLGSSEYIRRSLAGLRVPFRFFPEFSSEEAISYVRASPRAVVCLASPSDNFPHAALEMAQVPVPLVVSDTTGFHQTLELTGRREGVFWFQPGSAESLRRSLAEALAAEGGNMVVPTAETIKATNEKLAMSRFDLLEEAFAANQPDWLPANLRARAIILADGNARAVRSTLRSLARAADDLAEVVVLAMTVWSHDDQETLQQAFPLAVFLPSADLHQALAASGNNPQDGNGNHLLLLRAGTTIRSGTVREFLEAGARTQAAMVTAAQFEGAQRREVRSFQPGSVPLLLRANRTSGACVLFSRPFVDSLPRTTTRTPEMLIWQLTLAAAATGARSVYIPYPTHAAPRAPDVGTSPPDVEPSGIELSRYAAAIPGARWTRREIFGLALATQQLNAAVRKAQGDIEELIHQHANAKATLQTAIAAARTEGQEQRAHAATAREQAALLRQELDALYASKSWHVTKPLRLLYQCLAAIKAGWAKARTPGGEE